MQPALCALLVTAIATAALMIGRVYAAPRDFISSGTSASQDQRESSTEAGSPPPVRYATVVKAFGASIRVAPGQDAAGLFNAGCGTLLPVIGVESGWVKVRTPLGDGWVGDGRVVVSDAPAPVDCSGKRTLDKAADARVLVPADCAALQPRPSREADALDCIQTGHRFTVVDGPFDPGTGEDWFKVTSTSTGTGWLPGEFLYPM